MSNPYYKPEEMGLEIVGEIEYSGGFYEFDTRVIWKDKEGNLYTARDSGCSCPSPFEDYSQVGDLDRLDLDALKAEVRTDLDNGYSCTSLEAGQDLVRKIELMIRSN